MKGIILAGGTASRLFPATSVVSKQLLPIYDKPMIYYPLSTLMLAQIREVLLISTPLHLPSFQQLLGDGSQLGMSIQYKIQEQPKGLVEAFTLGEEFINHNPCSLILGDNIFFGQGFSSILQKVSQIQHGAEIFGYSVINPSEYGVVEFDAEYNVLSLEEKPITPKSYYAIPGLYFYDNTVVERAKSVRPSARGELEITTLNQSYLDDNQLKVSILGRGFAWLDTGSPECLLEASSFVKTIQSRQNHYIACIEEIAARNKWITIEQLEKIGRSYTTDYGRYILELCKEL
ncbi:MAG: glucose-1-phosphate thymidylyltransferase RfbA [Brevinema sp.]